MNTLPSELEATSMALLSLGTLLAEGYDHSEHLWVREVPALNEALQTCAFDTQGWAAEYHRLFIREVHPFANVFLSSDASMGGLRTSWVSEDLQKMGLSIETANSEPDHLGHLIITLGHLVGAEQDAVEDHVVHAVPGLRALQAKWIDNHITPWLWIVTSAMKQQDPALYGEVLDLTAELVCALRCRLPNPYSPERQFVLPPTIADLDHPQTDIRQIATQLTTPALSGWYLSRGTLSLMGAQLDLPCGFGSRRLMMTNILHTAIDHKAIPKLCNHLLAVAADWRRALETAGRNPCPGWESVMAIWTHRLACTEDILNRLEAAVPAHSAS